LAATGRIEDLADAFGGSLALGLAVTIAVSSAVAALTYFGLRRIAGAKLEIVRAIAALLGLRPRRLTALAAIRAHHLVSHSRLRALRTRSAGKRGPPSILAGLALV
jgi:hypothetical protein